jgi:hypothetical protein
MNSMEDYTYAVALRELQKLNVGSVVLDTDGDAWQRGPRGWTSVVRGSNTENMGASSLAILTPLTVVHEAPPAHTDGSE